jgi:heme-degrading monooxygenase HmoA
MYVSLSRLRVAPDRADDLVSAFRNRAHLVDEADGFVDLEVWRSDRDATELIMVSRWRDRESFRAYMSSREHAASHRRIPPDLDAAIALERLEHLHTYDVVAT